MDIVEQERKEESRESGMTLIEVMVSTIVLGVVLVGLGQALTVGIKLNTENKMKISSLNACKQIIESLKTEISQSQAVFDGTAPTNTTYFVDANGNKTYSGSAGSKTEAFTSSTAFRANVVISNNNGLTQTVGGVTNVLVKDLTVTVVDVQNMTRSGRETSMKVEIIRPSA